MEKHISCLATTEWLQEVITPWIRKEPFLGATELHKKVEEHYGLGKIPYMRVWNATHRAVADINGMSWDDSFQLLYKFKAEVRSSPGSSVEIDHHVMRYKLRGKAKEKTCFWRAFVSFKACWEGFLNGCRPYLAVDATAQMEDGKDSW